MTETTIIIEEGIAPNGSATIKLDTPHLPDDHAIYALFEPSRPQSSGLLSVRGILYTIGNEGEVGRTADLLVRSVERYADLREILLVLDPIISCEDDSQLCFTTPPMVVTCFNALCRFIPVESMGE